MDHRLKEMIFNGSGEVNNSSRRSKIHRASNASSSLGVVHAVNNASQSRSGRQSVTVTAENLFGDKIEIKRRQDDFIKSLHGSTDFNSNSSQNNDN